MIELVIFDYDGTLTDIRDGSPAFDERYCHALADFLGIGDLSAQWHQAKQKIRAASPEAAWMIGGNPTAPAAADPYTLASEAAALLLETVGDVPARLRGTALTEIYHLAYGGAPYHFRRDARVVVSTVAKTLPTYVVTNSATDTVTARLGEGLFKDGHGGLGSLKVEGNARKFLIAPPSEPDPRFGGLHKTKRVPHLERDILLHRGHYFDVLARLWKTTGARPETTLVCGDVWELDLAMPAALGCHVHLVERANVYPFELEQVRALADRGASSVTLLPILTRLG